MLILVYPLAREYTFSEGKRRGTRPSVLFNSIWNCNFSCQNALLTHYGSGINTIFQALKIE